MTSGIQKTTFHLKEMMQVQPSDNLLNAHLAKSSQDTPHRKVTPADDSALGGLSNGVAGFIRKALETDCADSAIIEQAKNAMGEGMLDTPETYTAVAANLLAFGI